MATITLKGNPIQTCGELPALGSLAPDFKLTTTDLQESTSADYVGKRVVFNIFPSIDTPVCAASARRFNSDASSLENTVVLCISADLPFAHKRFCEAEGLEDVIPLSTFRSSEFAKIFGVHITTGPLRGLLCRAVVIADTENVVIYTEQVSEIAQEPNYDAALAALRKDKLSEDE